MSLKKCLSSRVVVVVSLAIAIGTSLLILNAPDVNNDPFLGDDLEVWVASSEGRFASHLQESVRNVNLDKWRPINTALMIPLLNVLKDSYRNYYYFSTGLLVLMLISMWWVIRTITTDSAKSSTISALLGILVVGGSPFTFFARAGVFGLLEIGPVILCLWSFYTYQRACELSSRRLIGYSSMMALASGLIHERFFMFSFGLAVMIAWRSREIKRFRSLWLVPIGNIAFYFYTATVVLNANVLKGGGESQFNESVGLWVVPRFVNATIHMLGGAGGEPVFYDAFQPLRFAPGMSFVDNYSLVVPVLTVLFAVSGVVPHFRTEVKRRAAVNEAKLARNSGFESLFVSACLLVPAATVAERIEARWLFGPLVFLVIAVAHVPRPEWPLSKIGRFGVLTLLLLGNLGHRSSYQEFDWWRVRSNNILEVVRENEPASGEWNVAVVWPDWQDINSVTRWGLGNGRVFRDLGNGPSEIVFGTYVGTENCPAPCLVVEVTDVGNTKRDARKAEFQTVTTVWRN